MDAETVSGHFAAISLSEDGKDPYVTIFYTVERGAIAFTALLVVGTQAVEEEKRLIYKNGSAPTTDPDEVHDPLVVGWLYPDGSMIFEHGIDIKLSNEQESLSLICVMRALYQMQSEMTKEKA